MVHLSKLVIPPILVMTLAGCWNQGNCHIDLGTVSLGKQFEDLKSALDSGALSPQEYEIAKRRVLDFAALCKAKSEPEN